MIFVNFKTYRQGTGEAAVKLAQICQKVAQETSMTIIPLVQAADVFRLASQGFVVWTQHVDNISFGPNTGQTLPETVLAAGAKGTLLNHSENKLPLAVIKETIRRCRALQLKVLVCSDSPEEAKQLAEMRPDFLAYEPPELIGSQTSSVATAKPEVVTEVTEAIKTLPFLVGAGIHSQNDVRQAIKLGAKGVLVASDIVLAQEPEKELIDLVRGFRS